MSVTAKALFVIERNLGDALALDDVAERCRVSRFHLCHAFGETTGMSVKAYIRRRRLTHAAHALAQGAQSIVDVAAEAGYASHEAFTRAFKAQFGVTPAAARKHRLGEGDGFLEAVALPAWTSAARQSPRVEEAGALRFVGRAQRVPFDRRQDIAGQWGRFMASDYAAITHRLPEPPVGVVTQASDDGITYACAAPVDVFAAVPKGCIKLSVAPARYAVFLHRAHVARIGDTYRAIWDDWFPQSGKQPADAPVLERHADSFDPRTGLGGVAIWIPLEE